MYIIATGSFNLVYRSLKECSDAISRFNLKRFVVTDQETGKICFDNETFNPLFT